MIFSHGYYLAIILLYARQTAAVTGSLSDLSLPAPETRPLTVCQLSIAALR